jgi:uncharacterized protein
MKLLVERLSSTPTRFHFEADSAWWAALRPREAGLPTQLALPLAFELSAHCMGHDLYLEGSAAGELELECSRCLARYRHGLREPFRLVLEPAGARVPADPEAAQALARDGMCLGSDLETGWYRGSEVHLGHFFLEVIALALPVKPLCREDCPGLCSRCGADLGQGPCGCSDARPDSPFAALAALRTGLRGGKS